jgi:hypothetical protein
MTIVNSLVRSIKLKDVQFWRERNGSWTVTAIFEDQNRKTVALEMPEHIFQEVKSTHDRFVASGKQLETPEDKRATPA